MKIYTFDTKNNNNSTFFHNIITKSNNTNYSALLDNIISSNLKKTNSYLTSYFNKIENDNLIDELIAEAKCKNSKCLKGDNFIAALTYLTKFGKTNKLPFELGHTYYFNDSTPIIFHLDSIQIGKEEYYYDDLLNNTFTPTTKKNIIDIYLNGNNANININI